MGSASTNGLQERFFAKSSEWTRKLVTAINPKLIICEGKTAFINTLNCFSKNVQMTQDCQIDNINKIPVIGYKRHGSRIRDKIMLSDMITKHS